MPVHIEEVNTDVTMIDGDLPLSPQQIEKLVKIVLQRIEENNRRMQRNRNDTQLRNSVQPMDSGPES